MRGQQISPPFSHPRDPLRRTAPRVTRLHANVSASVARCLPRRAAPPPSFVPPAAARAQPTGLTLHPTLLDRRLRSTPALVLASARRFRRLPRAAFAGFRTPLARPPPHRPPRSVPPPENGPPRLAPFHVSHTRLPASLTRIHAFLPFSAVDAALSSLRAPSPPRPFRGRPTPPPPPPPPAAVPASERPRVRRGFGLSMNDVITGLGLGLWSLTRVRAIESE